MKPETQQNTADAARVGSTGGSGLHAAADRLHEAIAVMLKDWRDGDFELPPLTKIHVEHIEEKYLEVGKALRADNEVWEKFQREVLHPNNQGVAHGPNAETSNKQNQ